MTEGTIERELKNHEYGIFQTVGVSMRPLLKEHDTHVVLKRAEGPLSKGDLPLYRRPNGRYVLHRVIKVCPGGYQIRGDNTYALEYVSEDQIIGITTRIYRGDHYTDVTDWHYRTYVTIWNTIYPLRWIMHKTYAFARKIKKKIKI